MLQLFLLLQSLEYETTKRREMESKRKIKWRRKDKRVEKDCVELEVDGSRRKGCG